VFNLGDGWAPVLLHVNDFAGGTAVHINAGAAGLALALVLGKRHGWPKERFKPHNLPLVLIGAGILWFGWFGFNAGSAVAANGQAGVAFINTQVATAAAMMGWLVVEKLRDGHATTLGAASGAVAGLVAITPACASVNPVGAIILGILTGALCAVAVGLKYKLGFDDSLDVVGVHLVGGATGAILIGFLATPTVTGILGDGTGPTGLFFGGGVDQLWRQVLAVIAVGAYSFILTYIIGKIIDKTMGFRISIEEEITGIDTTVHAESGYDFTSTGSGPGLASAAAAKPLATASAEKE
jgi:Amt family ammonium transporter